MEALGFKFMILKGRVFFRVKIILLILWVTISSRKSRNKYIFKLLLFYIFMAFEFLNNKLSNFGTLTLGEQISYSAFGLGFVLVLVSIILFIL